MFSKKLENLMLLVGIIMNSRQTCAVEEYLSPTFRDNTEPILSRPPCNDNCWADYKEGAEFVGLLLAGELEFNWIIDVSTDSDSEETVSTGNLLSMNHVLVTCRSVHAIDPDGDGRGFQTVKLRFCLQHLQEGLDYHNNFKNEFLEAHWFGTRRAAAVTVHPKCRRGSARNDDNDIAIIVLNEAIHPRLPSTVQLFMPVIQDAVSMKIPKYISLEKTITKKLVCYVASFGRSYRNIEKHLAVDYKVKYRVYREDWIRCSENWDKICPDDSDSVCEARRNSGVNFIIFDCMKPRARVGAVCDHDRGAPLVCNGVVYGIVSRAADWKYCNNLVPLPFVVLKVQVMSAYYNDNTLKLGVQRTSIPPLRE